MPSGAPALFSSTSDPAQRAAELIKALLDPRYSSSAGAISQQLLEIQLSPQGWTVADALLASEDRDLQFYGALSFQVKLNRDGGSGKSLNEQDAALVLDRLIHAFCSCVNGNGPSRVLDKICSALATYFVQTPIPWTIAIGKTAACLLNPNNTIGSLPEGDYSDPELFKHLSVRQMQALLRLCTLFAEDLGKFESKTLKQHHLEEAFRTCVPAFHNVMLTALLLHQTVPAHDPRVVEEALAAYASWSAYAVQHWKHERSTFTTLQSLTDVVMRFLAHRDGALAMAAADSLAEVLALDSGFVTKPQLSNLWPLIRQMESLEIDAADKLSLLKLTTAWGECMVPEIIKQPEEGMFREATARLTWALFDIDWADEGCERMALLGEFWLHFVEDFVEYSAGLDEGIQTRLKFLIESVLDAFFESLTWRDGVNLSDVDEDYINAWKRCCEDFAELLARLLESGQIRVYNKCADQLEKAIIRESWPRMEIVFSVLNSMANDYDGMPASEEGVARIFTSSLFLQITQPGALDQIPGQLKRLLVRFIDNYSSYFQQSPSQIPSIVTLLMNILKQNTSQKTKLADLSARCLASICSSCRKVLVAMSDELLAFCDSALIADNLTPYQREKIYSGMAFVIQAIPDERNKVEPIKLLISKLHQELNVSKQLLSQGQQEQGEQIAVTAYECLAAVGKALHSGTSTINVEEDDAAPANGEQQVNPWTGEQGQAIQMQVIECLRYIELMPSNGDAWEGVCIVLRVGLSETEPGPFVFPTSLVSGFLASMTPSTPRLEALLTTACAFISANSRSTTSSVPTEISPVLAAVSRVLLSLETPQTDPALAQLCTDFLERTLTRHAPLLLSEPNLEAVLHFQLAALTSDAPMLKRASAAFFAAALAQLPQLAAVLTDPLAAAIAHQVAGAAQRSELDAVARVLRSLLLSGPGGKVALERALVSVTAVGEAEKRVFVQKVVMLRGGRGTAEAVREFWAKARGTVGSF